MKKLPKGYAEYFADLKEYEGLDDEAQQYIYQFYLENYRGNNVDNSTKLLKSPNMVKVATANHNSVKRDAMRVGHKIGKIKSIDDVNALSCREFMEEVVKEDEWLTAYKIGGYELAAKQIVGETIDSVKLTQDEKLISHYLFNMIISFRELRLEHRRQTRNKGEFK